MEPTILHIDMDAFYAAIEQLDNPSLKGKPVIVGGGMRGVVSTASYEARAFGVHSAMPIFEARRLCRQGVFLPVRMKRYRAVSKQIMAFLTTVSPVVEVLSIDEAYLDITGTARLLGDPIALARKIKGWILQETRLTCSIGMAPNKFLAKIASDWKKPDGLTIIREDEVDGFLKELPVAKLPGVGKRALKILEGLGITRTGQLRQLPEGTLAKKFGKFGRRLADLSRGIDHSPVISESQPKSISSENTMDEDTDDPGILRRYILAQAENVGRRLRKHSLRGRTITLKLKYSDFRLITRSRTIEVPTNSTTVIVETASDLLQNERRLSKVRLIGVGISHFEESIRQLTLFERSTRQDQRQTRLDSVIDEVAERFGEDVLKRGGS
ncbi:MAG: DNA polymerase IV [Proteobacteria bacterium]|nr:DNA polymerase IV [Pseudomonadota bacterium]NIS68447.1 DNA polymerase IV [Pseudomonadota bacterium]